jgi:uncharacterized membrane protein YphA (DoxX/SURF4 family)
VTLVLLRAVIGVHFYLEGSSKMEEPRPFSAGFFENAKGPLAPFYRSFVWDPDGRLRLGLPMINDPSLGGRSFGKQLDLNPTLVHWENYRDRIGVHFGFDEKQTKEADRITKAMASRYRGFISSNMKDIEEYYQQLVRRDAYAQREERLLASLQAQDARNMDEWMKLRAPLLATIDGMWSDLERQLNDVATRQQRQARGYLPIGRLKEPALVAERFDKFIPYFDMAIGILLIVGLFTRTAAVLGGLFLLSICSTQWPGYPGSAPVYYQAVEALALFALAANGGGKWASVDALLGRCCQWCCRNRSAARGTQEPAATSKV